MLLNLVTEHLNNHYSGTAIVVSKSFNVAYIIYVEGSTACHIGTITCDGANVDIRTPNGYRSTFNNSDPELFSKITHFIDVARHFCPPMKPASYRRLT